MENADIMTVEEVARYVRVSDRTVYDWAQRGEIPCGKLGTTWRFKRSEIERWVNDRLGGQRSPTAGMGMDKVLEADRVLLLDVDAKEDALNQMIDVLHEKGGVKDRAMLAEAIFEREELMSTGIGLGIGVPHVRLQNLSTLVMAFAVCRRPLGDYESLDGEPVRILCMVACGKDQHAHYLKLLASLSSKLKDEYLREALFSADSEEEIFAILMGEE